MSNNDRLAKPIHSRVVATLVATVAFTTSQLCQEQDFGSDLPSKLLVGLTSLFTSKLATLVTFCAGHKELRAALPVCAVTCLPATFFAIA
ncbi:hypothetical protein CK203_002558 [Vitis vinifera]|uniref:Uncharacterized protein n=1 Tax=Vitis vinifera TaxID=29760 RepID=A0A438KH10_VITVI|nr:hypothetical protein CK203_002558 [Vitis vinifera]